MAISTSPTPPSATKPAPIIKPPTKVEPAAGAAPSDPNVVEMSWDPITRIVGSLGIYTKIDFAKKQVVKCHSTSSIFRGYSIFM
jgi:hydrogenase large subunit